VEATAVPPALAALGNCPACGEAPLSALACLRCGAVLARRPEASAFEDLGLPRAIGLDLDAAERTYLRLSRLLHPDFHGGADPQTVERANRNSALLNEAWETLSDDARRAESLLELHAPGALEAAKALSPAFLMEAMETSEQVESAGGDPAALAALRGRVEAEVAARLADVTSEARWNPPDPRHLATTLHELRTLRRILRDLENSA